jgi:hypothetical protein
MDLTYFRFEADELARLVDIVEPILDEVGTPTHKSDFYGRLGQWHFLKEHFLIFAETLAFRRRSLRYDYDTGDRSQICYGHFALGFSLLWHGDLDEAAAELTYALSLAEEIGRIYVQNQALSYLMIVYRLGDDVAAVRAGQDHHLDLSQRIGNPNYIGVAQANQAWLHYREGLVDSARRQAQTALATWGEEPFYPFQWLAQWLILAVTLEHGQISQAVEAAGAMLHSAQQRLPDDVTENLKRAVHKWDEGQEESTRRALWQSMKLAQELGYF